MDVTQTRTGRVVLGVLIFNMVVGVWDWIARINGLDPYFGTQQDTALGHVVRFVFSPLVLFGIVVIFGLVWCLEPWFRKSPPVSARIVSATESDLQHTLRTTQEELKRAIGERDNLQLELAASKAEGKAPRKDLTRALEPANSVVATAKDEGIGSDHARTSSLSLQGVPRLRHHNANTHRAGQHL